VVRFSLTMFVSAALLFLVEPMFAKMVLPLLGGTPAVWNTCMVFFQAVLLAGYAHAHASANLLSRRGQITLHVAVLLTPLVVLPVHIPTGWGPPSQHDPVFWLLMLLFVSVGLPFFALSANTPTLQKWFAQSGHPSATDPYFLYAASNAGSLLGLLSYPFLLEPTLRLADQSRVWAWCYGLSLVLTGACAVALWGAPRTGLPWTAEDVQDEAVSDRAGEGESRPTPGRRFRWVALAFVNSSLMLGVTTALTTDIPAIPFLWVLPLALYLLSFTLVFARKPILSRRWLIRRLPFLILASTIPMVSKATLPLLILVALDLVTLFAVAMVCHGELARTRPSTSHLTEFYLWISVGGVLGGIFNALVAPLVFTSVVEFPLVLVLAALLRPPVDVVKDTPRARKLDFVLPLVLGLCASGVILALQAMGLKPGRTLNILVFGYSMVWCLSFGKRPVRFALGLAALLLASTAYTGPFGHILRTERSFFGVYRVTDDDDRKYRMLFHGGTIQGVQSLDPARRHEPLSYYTRTGPIGQVFAALTGDVAESEVAIVGLGVGSMACYFRPSQHFTVYEIDPAVKEIAENSRYFTFVRDCAPLLRVVLGDARLSLREAPDHHYGLMILDAFSGDSIPMHLLTREAVRLYLDKLAPGGVLAFHISNLHLDLRPVLDNLARDAGLMCLFNNDVRISTADVKNGKFPSVWAVMAHSSGDLRQLSWDVRWKPLPHKQSGKVWTDDFSSIVSIIRLN